MDSEPVHESRSPIPDGLETVYTFPVKIHDDSEDLSYIHNVYEKPVRLNSGRVAPSLVDVMWTYLFKKANQRDTPHTLASSIMAQHLELQLIVQICPPDALLADYRALRLRAYFDRFLRAAIDAMVSPDGTSNAARVLTSEGGFRKDSFSELTRVMIAGLLSGTDSSIASAVRLYLESVS